LILTTFNIEAKGTSQHLFKVGSKRRRSMAELAAEQDEASMREEAFADKVRIIEELRQQQAQL
jgi:hypothetical protein